MVGQSPQATHLGRPSAWTSILCVPRHLGERSGLSSGYSSVTFSVSMRCRKVSAIPLRVARKYDVVPRGRSITFTPIAIRRLPPILSLLSIHPCRDELRLRLRFHHGRRRLAGDDQCESIPTDPILIPPSGRG